ncbi:hypothetical protein PISMIDRAFT_680853 [Pisolithus microcarpus 441]|uniref:Uncharacterized protein n=1 Tax=Pisolithus microcarpus 441 TaxID=765257 RepID=A0A0C9Z7A4_9AGAM|nr:hypothetical protein PISMIDRAFT_680853 [Pisolithus microcarpus 441]
MTRVVLNVSKVRVSFSFTYTRFAALCSSGLDDSVSMQPKGQRHTILRSSESTMCRSWSSEALKPVNNPTGWTGGHSFENGPLLSIEDDQYLQTRDEMILDIPDPPEVHAGCPTLWDNPETMGNTLEDPSSSSRCRRGLTSYIAVVEATSDLIHLLIRSRAM